MNNPLVMPNFKFTENRWRIRNDDLQLQQYPNCLQQSLPEDLGFGYSKICQLDDGLTYIESEYKPSKNLSVLSQSDDQEPTLVVTLGLSGCSRFVSQHDEKDIVFNEGYTSITTFKSRMGERQYQANEHIHQLRFSINKNWLKRYFDDTKTSQLFNNKSVQTISYKPITTQGMIVAQQFHSYGVSNQIKKLFIHGQALTLLASELAPLFSSNTEATEKFSQKDKEIVNAARDILYQAFQNPPSVEQLSKQVACNQFKLKQLFHHFFNNTPYGVLLEIRMNKAYQLLESSHCHVNIAADFVGYKHASNFSTAFIKFFGISPKSVAKK